MFLINYLAYLRRGNHRLLCCSRKLPTPADIHCLYKLLRGFASDQLFSTLLTFSHRGNVERHLLFVWQILKSHHYFDPLVQIIRAGTRHTTQTWSTNPYSLCILMVRRTFNLVSFFVRTNTLQTLHQLNIQQQKSIRET